MTMLGGFLPGLAATEYPPPPAVSTGNAADPLMNSRRVRGGLEFPNSFWALIVCTLLLSGGLLFECRDHNPASDRAEPAAIISIPGIRRSGRAAFGESTRDGARGFLYPSTPS